MIKCENACPRGKFDGCCHKCPDFHTCPDSCQENPNACGSATSQNAYDFFTQNDDGMGQERGELLNRIIPKLEKRDAGYQARWGKIWEEALCQKYKRPDQEEHWIWNFDFYNGPVEDLRYIAALIGA